MLQASEGFLLLATRIQESDFTSSSSNHHFSNYQKGKDHLLPTPDGGVLVSGIVLEVAAGFEAAV